LCAGVKDGRPAPIIPDFRLATQPLGCVIRLLEIALEATHNQYMRTALQLAKRGTGHASPNPLVGCVVVKDDKIVGRGWHQQYGGPHAEVNALTDAGKNAIGATVYVTLEPCAHEGKTPPCVNALIAAKVNRVIVAARDPNPIATGGIEQLRHAGITVVTGVETEAADYLNRAFVHRIKSKRPWVVAKTATSLDGRIATRTGHSQWITGPNARRRSHDLRQMVDAIIVGAETVRADNPALTVRNPLDKELAELESAHPLRVIVSARGELALNLHAVDGSLPGQTLVATTEHMSANTEQQLLNAGNEVLRLACDSSGYIPIEALLNALAPRCQSVLVEGGAHLLGAFVDAGFVDEVWAFIAPKWIGGAKAPGSVGGLGVSRLENALELKHLEHEQLEPDWLMRGLVNRAPTSHHANRG